MDNNSNNKIKPGQIVTRLLIFLVFLSACKKLQDAYISISSREQKLIYKSWILQRATKDGINITPVTCASGSPNRYDINFRTPGEVEIRCSLLLANSRADIGTWELKNRKNIEMTLTDSSYYDHINHKNVYVPVAPVNVKWGIKKLSGSELLVKETRIDEVYEFFFNNG